jgi:hypothetical protein
VTRCSGATAARADQFGGTGADEAERQPEFSLPVSALFWREEGFSSKLLDCLREYTQAGAFDEPL